MKTVAATLVVSLSPLLLIGQTQQSSKPRSISQSFVMAVSEDGKEQAEWFELWEISGEFGG